MLARKTPEPTLKVPTLVADGPKTKGIKLHHCADFEGLL